MGVQNSKIVFTLLNKDYVVAAVAKAMFDPSSSSSSHMNDLSFLADTEESDGPTDVELGRADYWTCVKCKNRQNNPMYRYCEKCYQVKMIVLLFSFTLVKYKFPVIIKK